MRIPKTVKLQGIFPDQQGTAERGKITGHNGNGVPCREYTWTNPKLKKLTGKTFEALDTQILHAIVFNFGNPQGS